MARQKRMTVGSKYVAIGALVELLRPAMGNEGGPAADQADAERIAQHVVEQAWDVEHFPTAGRVQITLDLGPLLDKPADAPQ